MVTVNTIRDGVIAALARLFPKLNVCEEEGKQGIEAPRFFVKLVETEQVQELNRRYRRKHTFDIQYFPAGDSNRAMHDIAERLYEHMRYIEIDGVLYRGTSLRHEIVNGVLHFFVDYIFHVMHAEPEAPTMGQMKQEGFIK